MASVQLIPFEDDVLDIRADDDPLEDGQKSLVERVQALKITSAETARTGVELLDGIAELRKQIAEHHEPTIKAAHATHKAALAAKAKLDDPLKAAESMLRTALGAFEQAERGRAEAERRAEQERLAKKAKEAEQAGDHEVASALRLAPVTTPEHAPSIPTSAKYEVEVTDLLALVRAVAAGEVPVAALEPDLTTIRKAAEALSGELRWPGVQVTKTRTVRRARK